MIPEIPIFDEINKIIVEAQEKEEAFIFRTIKPSIVEREISKADLVQALTLWQNHNKRLESDLDNKLDKICAEIQMLRGCSCNCSDGIIDDVEDIIDKYRSKKNE